MFWVSWKNTLVFSLTVTLKILVTLNVWGLSPTSTNVPTRVVCPTTQFSADTVYLDLVSDSTTERLNQSHQAPPISDAKRKFQIVICTSDWSALNQVPMTPSSSLIIC